MPVKRGSSTAVVESLPRFHKAKGTVARLAASVPSKPSTGELLEQIKIRGEQLSSEIKQLLVRLG